MNKMTDVSQKDVNRMQMLIIKVLVTIDKYKGLFLQKKTQ